MKVAVVGAGISGLVCAYVLSRRHEVTLIESESRLGGHTHTHRVEHEGQSLNVDSGFIVFNERNYPNFCELLRQLNVESRPTTMSFSVRHEPSGLEYGGTSLRGLFAQRRNLINPSFYRMLADIYRLGRDASFLSATLAPTLTDTDGIADVLKSLGYSDAFIDRYLVPMGAAIWSASQADARRIPAKFFLRFFQNHGMLDLSQRPQWRTVAGGSSTYVQALAVELGRRGVRVIRGDPCRAVSRTSGAVRIATQSDSLAADHVILACHSNDALAMLTDATAVERDVLGAMPYQQNDAVLHRDARLLPTRRSAWAAWNATVPRSTDDDTRVIVTYNMNMLQGLSTRTPLCVTLNQTERIDPGSVIATMKYAHPAYDVHSTIAQTRHAEISGSTTSGFARTHYCGAYWGNGFHEDGVVSALRVCSTFGLSLEGEASLPAAASRLTTDAGLHQIGAIA